MTDLFCGAGGSSTGAVQVPGVRVRIAANHWDLSVAVHNQNHPDTDHSTADLHEEDPAWTCRPTSEPLRRLTTGGHQSVITPGQLAAAEAQVDDCLFRMMRWHKCAAGQAFPTRYDWNVLDGRGRRPSNRNLVKMIGNAVTPPAARDLIGAIVEAATGELVLAA